MRDVSLANRDTWLARNGAALAGLIFLLAFYWRGLGDWFYQDDFGWLHLGPATDFGDFLTILFVPKAHGNIRPWSENLFFYGLKALFGVNPLPFRIVVFATVAADVVLLVALVRRLTGSVFAAACSPILWLANPCVAPALCWTSIYNESQYLVFVLLALLLFLRGKYWQQIIVFVLGLGSLEMAVMYPVIALAYALLFDRAKVRRTVPLFVISAAYTALHFWAAPGAKSGPYAIQIDSRIFGTLVTYVRSVLGPQELTHFHWDWPAWITIAGTAVIGAGVIAAIIVAGRVGLFGLAWFIALLVPMLPLPEHVEDYALTGPAIGLAMILAGALARKPRAIAPLAVAYLAICLPAAWDVTSFNVDRSDVARDLVSGVVEYDRAHPGKILLVTGLSTDQFYAGFADRPFETFGIQNVYIAPGGAAKVDDSRGWLPRYDLPPATVKALIDAGKAAVLDVSNGQVRDVTPK
ncbi:MAG TPA: hypothetical protein VK724_02215 [Bryobacteraceae bacterium]|nr:hypothetical protein [Bryobacteraceae bacterium]